MATQNPTVRKSWRRSIPGQPQGLPPSMGRAVESMEATLKDAGKMTSCHMGTVAHIRATVEETMPMANLPWNMLQRDSS